VRQGWRDFLQPRRGRLQPCPAVEEHPPHAEPASNPPGESLIRNGRRSQDDDRHAVPVCAVPGECALQLQDIAEVGVPGVAPDEEDLFGRRTEQVQRRAVRVPDVGHPIGWNTHPDTPEPVGRKH